MHNQFTIPLWGDEGFSAILSMHSLPDIVRIIIDDTSPPLWNIFEWLVFNTFGTNEIYIRGLAFSFYLITIFFSYKIGSYLWERKTGMFAAVLIALNPFFFIYAFEGRMYSIMAAGVAGSMYFFLKMLYGNNNVIAKNKLNLLGYIIMTMWALYSHHFAIFAVITQGAWWLYFVATKNKAAKLVFLGFVGAGIGYLPWIWPLYQQISKVGTGFWLGRPVVADLFGLILEYLAYGIKHMLSFPALVMICTALVVRKWHRDIQKSLIITSWFLVPIIAAFVISYVFTPVFFSRYLVYTIPAAMIVVASGRRMFGNFAIATAIGLFIIIDIFYFTHPSKPRFDQLAEYVKAELVDKDYLINWNGTPHFLWESKYYGIPAPLYLEGEGDLPYFVGTALMTNEDIIRSIPDDPNRVGVITSGNIEDINIPGYTESSRKIFDQVKFAWFEKDIL